MEGRIHEGVTTYDLLGLTVAERVTILRALHRSYKDHGDTEAESLRCAMLGGEYPG